MSIFNLPDLGEGLPDAEIREWYVKEGEELAQDAPMCALETAKAVVDVPAPFSGTVKKLYGGPGDVIQTGRPLIDIDNGKDAPAASSNTVVGELKGSDTVLVAKVQTIGQGKATPAVRALAKKHKVDLSQVTPTGPDNTITRQDVLNAEGSAPAKSSPAGEQLRGARRTMSKVMQQSHATVVPVTIFARADITHWQEQDITVRLIEAIKSGVKIEPKINAHFDGQSITTVSSINLGMATDTEDGLFVPVIQGCDALDAGGLRAAINELKQQIQARSIKPENLKGATFTLSNFGRFAGEFATPIVTPPQVAILAAGKTCDTPVVHKGKVVAGRVLPLSLTFDHRALTGGEGARFLGAVVESLEV